MTRSKTEKEEIGIRRGIPYIFVIFNKLWIKNTRKIGYVDKKVTIQVFCFKNITYMVQSIHDIRKGNALFFFRQIIRTTCKEQYFLKSCQGYNIV